MVTEFDTSEFVDSDFSAAPKPAGVTGSPVTPQASFPNRPPTREELDSRLSESQHKLAELKRAQEELERARAGLEEARRRQAEFQTGRNEMLQHLTRGTGLLEKAEFTARRDAEQMAKTLAGLQDALAKVQAIHEETWTRENYNTELTQALTTIENARMEWNAARLKWTLLAGTVPLEPAPAEVRPPSLFDVPAHASFGQLCRLGLALTWPLALVLLSLGLCLLFRR